MKLALLIIFISFYLTDPNIKMGFEIEITDILVNQEISVTDPVIEKNTWKLFTDMCDDDDYTLEFATKYGYDKDTVIQSAVEIQDTIYKIIEGIKKSGERLLSFKTFSNLIGQQLLIDKEIVKCLFRDNVYACNTNISAKHMKDHMNCYLSVLKKYGIVKNEKIVLNKLEEDLKSEIDKESKYLDESIKKFEIMYSKADSKKGESLVKKLKRDKTALKDKIKKKIYCDYFSKTNKDLFQNKTWISEDSKIDLLNTIDSLAVKDRQKLKTTAKLATQHLGYISEIFYKRDKSLEIRKKFQPYCRYNLINVDEKAAISYCDPRTVDSSFQLSLQLPIGSIAKLLKFFSKMNELLLYNEYNVVDHFMSMPMTLLDFGKYLLDTDGHSSKFYNDNFEFNQLWNINSRYLIKNYIEVLYDKQEEDRQAEGLFYLVLSYANQIFKRATTDEELEAQENDLPYGPKRNLEIMSRISFSEMYDNMRPNERKIFTKLFGSLCGVDIRTPKLSKEDIIDAQVDADICKKMYLVQYGIMQGYDYDPEAQKKEPLSFFTWIRSIINTKNRFKSQPKIVNRDPSVSYRSTKKKIEYVDSDYLSPPLCYTRTLDEELAENDNELIDKYGSKAIYSMGAFTGVLPGYTIIEFRSFPSIHITANHIASFVTDVTNTLYSMLEEEHEFSDMLGRIENIYIKQMTQNEDMNDEDMNDEAMPNESDDEMNLLI